MFADGWIQTADLWYGSDRSTNWATQPLPDDPQLPQQSAYSALDCIDAEIGIFPFLSTATQPSAAFTA